MARERIHAMMDWLKRVVTEPRHELTRWQKAARYMVDLSRAGARQLRTDDAPRMAGALAFRTLFGLLPVLVVSTVLARALMGSDFERFLLTAAERIATQLGVPEIDMKVDPIAGPVLDPVDTQPGTPEIDMKVDPVAGPVVDPVDTQPGTPEIDMKVDPVAGPVVHPVDTQPGILEIEPKVDGTNTHDWLKDAVVRPAMSIDWRALGWVGVGVVIYAAIGLMVTIEKSFNAVLRAPEGRPWISRVTIYWTVLTVSPLVIALTLAIDGWFHGMLASLTDADAGAMLKWLLRSANVLWSFCATWLFMTVVYKLVPNTTVRFRSVLTGALVAAVLLEVGKRTLGVYVTRLAVNPIYGSLGLIPIFMFWVYLMWLVVLLGLEVVACLQMLSGRTWEEMERQRRSGPEMIDPAAILGVMEIVVERFQAGDPTPAHVVSETTGLPESAVHVMLERLVDAGMLHQVERPESAFVLATPPDKLDAQQVMDIGFDIADEIGGHRSPLLQRMRDAQRNEVAKSSLA